jgi:hypothetical protein
VTEHPCAAWTSQQIVEAFANQDAPQYLLRDRDNIYGNEVRLRISSLQIEEVLTAPPESLAESLRRTPDRLDPQGLPGPFHHLLQRAASETNPEFIFYLLSPIEDSFRSRQAMSTGSAGLECRNDRPDSVPRRPASSLRTHGSVMLCLRTHFWRTTGLSGATLATLFVCNRRQSNFPLRWRSWVKLPLWRGLTRRKHRPAARYRSALLYWKAIKFHERAPSRLSCRRGKRCGVVQAALSQWQCPDWRM